MNIKYFSICLCIVLIKTCLPNNLDSKQKTVNTTDIKTKALLDDAIDTEKTLPQLDQGEEWLKSIFRTKNSDKYFPDDNIEEKLCTKRFHAFIIDSGELYGPSNLTDTEYPVAEKEYKAKWSTTYPIEEREMWLFGRGNGDIGELKQLEISKVKDQVYRVFIDYGNDRKTNNEVTIIAENGVYKIDYCKTEYVD